MVSPVLNSHLSVYAFGSQEGRRFRMESGRLDKYHWVESASFDVSKILRSCPEVVLGKFVIITAFDSGPLTLSPEAIARGWCKHGDLAVTSQISSVAELPFDDNDEWYVFPQYTLPQISETFVNDGIFRLASPDNFVRNAIAILVDQADLVGAKHLANRLAERQQIFWEQLRASNAESFIADGNTFMFASSNAELFERVTKAISNEDKC